MKAGLVLEPVALVALFIVAAPVMLLAVGALAIVSLVGDREDWTWTA